MYVYHTYIYKFTYVHLYMYSCPHPPRKPDAAEEEAMLWIKRYKKCWPKDILEPCLKEARDDEVEEIMQEQWFRAKSVNSTRGLCFPFLRVA